MSYARHEVRQFKVKGILIGGKLSRNLFYVNLISFLSLGSGLFGFVMSVIYMVITFRRQIRLLVEPRMCLKVN